MYVLYICAYASHINCSVHQWQKTAKAHILTQRECLPADIHHPAMQCAEAASTPGLTELLSQTDLSPGTYRICIINKLLDNLDDAE